MKNWVTLLSVLLFTFIHAQVDRPKLVVGIVVDQMRPDYLYRYNEDYGKGGFKRLLSEGFVFQNTHYNYMPTYTAPGHASIYTGATPSVHGIVGNSWFHRGENAEVYCTSDGTCTSVGIAGDDGAGQMSPYRLKATTVTDALKLDTNFKGKVIGISIKDRGAVLPAGHFADAAYWMNSDGKFISSSFYFDKLPSWVEDYNSKEWAAKYISQGWDLLKPAETYDESTADDVPYERVFEPKTKPVFPYDLKAIAGLAGDNEIIKTTPYGNTMVADLGKAAVINENLGKDHITDFLALSFSSPDYAGHNWAPRSVEIQDMYLRLDQTFADLFTFLDEKVGKGQYLLFITADHAVAENPKFLSDHKYHVQSLNSRDNSKKISALIQEEFGEGIFVNYSNQNIFLNEDKIKDSGKSYEDVVTFIQQKVELFPFVTRVYTKADILRGNQADYHLTMIARGYDPKQNGDLVVLLHPQFMESYETGTTHGSTYMYDSHVPNIWMGWGVKPGKSHEKTYITQIAPTISQMLNISLPNGSEAQILEELFNED